MKREYWLLNAFQRDAPVQFFLKGYSYWIVSEGYFACLYRELSKLLALPASLSNSFNLFLLCLLVFLQCNVCFFMGCSYLESRFNLFRFKFKESGRNYHESASNYKPISLTEVNRKIFEMCFRFLRELQNWPFWISRPLMILFLTTEIGVDSVFLNLLSCTTEAMSLKRIHQNKLISWSG